MARGRYSTYGRYAQTVGDYPRSGSTVYNGWAKGFNDFAEHNEIRDDEFYEGENVMIVGKGSIQMPRYGSENLVIKSGATKFNGGGIYKNPMLNTEIPLLMFDGRLYKYQSGTLSEIDPSKTWNTSARISGTMYKGWFYFCNGVDNMAKTDGNIIVVFNGISDPNNISVTYTGTSSNEAIYQFAVTVVTQYGETAYYSSSNFYAPLTLDGSKYFTVSTTRRTEPEVIGYNFYRSINGSSFQFLRHIPQTPSGNPTITDNGLLSDATTEAPTFNSTQGVKARYFATFRDTLFMAGVPDYPELIFYTGTGEYYESLSPDHNGGWVRIGEGDGTRVTRLIPFDKYLLILKETTIYSFDFSGEAFVITPVVSQYGSPYPFSIDKFEKVDLIMIGSDNQIRTIGYEPTLLNVIRTEALSNRNSKVFDEEFDFSNPDGVNAIYYDNKYIVCDGKIAVVYDRSYLGFHGKKWTNFNYKGFFIWRKDGKKYLLGVKDNGEVNKLLIKGKYTDNGVPIVAVFRPKTIDGKMDYILKYFRFLKFKFKDVNGTVTIRFWKDGVTTIDTKNISITGSTGFSLFSWGEPSFGEAPPDVILSETISVLGSTILYKKELYEEAYFIYPTIEVNGNDENHCLVQTISALYDYEDVDYSDTDKENIDYIDK